MGFDCGQTLPLCDLLYHPGDRFAQGLAEHGATGLADGRQAYMSPLLRTVVPQLAHQGAVRQEYEIHVPGLALALPELTIAHAQMLLPVPMEGLCSCPAFAIGLEDAMHFPIGSIGNQDLAWFSIPLAFPQHHNPHCVRDARNADTFGEVPLLFAIDDGLAPAQRPELRLHPLARLPVLAIDRDGAVELQVADIIPLVAVDVVEDFGVGKVAVEGKVTRNVLSYDPIDQFFAQDRMILERRLLRDAAFFLAEAAKLQGIVLARGTDVVGDQVIMGNQMALIGVIPEPASIFNQFSVMVDERVIDRDDTVLGIARSGVVLQEIEASLVEGRFIPIDLCDPAVQARLIGGDGKLTIDATHGFAFRDKQAGQILSEMLALGLIGKQVRVLGHEVLHDRRECNNCWHPCSWW